MLSFVFQKARVPRVNIKAITRLADSVSPRVEAQLLRAFGRLRFDREAFLSNLHTSDVVERSLDVSASRAVWAEQITPTLLALFTRSAEIAGRAMPKVLVQKQGLPESAFTHTDPYAQFYAQHVSSVMVKAEEDTKASIRAIIGDGFANGRTPVQMAKDIEKVIGLTPFQTQRLVDKRNKLLNQGMSLDSVGKILDRDQRSLIKHRANLIARTETLSSSNQGTIKAWQVAKSQGGLPLTLVKQFVVAADERLCPKCSPLEGEQAPIEQPFSFGKMTPPVHPACRCTVVLAEPKTDEQISAPTPDSNESSLPTPSALTTARPPRQAAQAAMHPTGSPEWMDDLLTRRRGPQAGTNPGGLFEDVYGTKYYVKEYKNAEQAASEVLSNRIYRDLGLGAPESHIVTSRGRTYFASRYLDDVEGTLGKLGLSADDAKKILDGFAADVFTLNWDAVGTGFDNVVRLQNGGVWRIDQGGTLFFRAQGALKPSSALDSLGEWTSLQTQNAYYARVFKAAGVKNANAIANIEQQIMAIDNLRVTGGGSWRKYIDSIIPDAPEDFRHRAALLLERRNALLMERLEGLRAEAAALKELTSRQQTILDALKTPQSAWPLADDVVRNVDAETVQQYRDHYAEWIKTLTPAERDAVVAYTGSGYRKINQILWEDPQLRNVTPLMRRRINNAQSALRKAPAPPNTVVWRRTSHGEFIEGQVVQLNGFQSSSINYNTWSGRYLLEIKPSCGAYVDPISRHKGEKEFLIPHGQQFKVVGRKMVKFARTWSAGGEYEQEVIQLEAISGCP